MNKADEDTASWFLSLSLYWMVLGNSGHMVFNTDAKEPQDRAFHKCDAEISVFKDTGRILSRADDNMFLL